MNTTQTTLALLADMLKTHFPDPFDGKIALMNEQGLPVAYPGDQRATPGGILLQDLISPEEAAPLMLALTGMKMVALMLPTPAITIAGGIEFPKYEDVVQTLKETTKDGGHAYLSVGKRYDHTTGALIALTALFTEEPRQGAFYVTDGASPYALGMHFLLEAFRVLVGYALNAGGK